jgi:hypothetical protein
VADRFLSAQQRRRIQQAIVDGHKAFLAELFGPTAIDREDYERLRASGKIRDEKLLPQDAALAAHSIGSIVGDEQVGVLAQMRAEAEREDVAAVHGLPAGKTAREFGVEKPSLLAPDEFWRRLRDDPQAITEAEREAVQLLRDRIGQHVRGLGARLDAATGQLLVDADDKLRRRRLVKVQQEVARGAQEKAEAGEVARRIRDVVKDLKRDWFRVAHTEMHNAVEEAKAIVLAHRSSDRDPRVFKRPRGDSCPFCILLYLKPDKVTPRVFRLSELLANGSNVGRRAGRPVRSGSSRTEWRAVVGATHPHCGCELNVLPSGMGFDERGNMVYSGTRKSVEVEQLDVRFVGHTCEE